MRFRAAILLLVLNATAAWAALPEDSLALPDVLRAVDATRKTPLGIAPLAAIESRLAFWPGHALREGLDTIARRRDTDPFVAARIEHLLLGLDRAAGRGASASDRAERLGVLSAFHVAGPEGAVDAPCETALPPSDGWVSAIGLVPDGTVHFDSLLWPGDDGAAFATTRIRIRRTTKAVLRLGADGPLRVWVDGAGVAEAKDLESLQIDQVAVPLLLPRGEHTLTMRVCLGGGAGTSLIARITGLDGRALGGIEPVDAPPGPTPPGPRATVLGRSVADPFGWWLARARTVTTPGDRMRAVRALAQAGRDLPPEIAPEALLGDDADSLMELAMLEPKGHRRVELLQRTLELDGEHVPAMLELAELLVGRQRYLAARQLLDDADARAPGDARSALLRARLLAENQVGGEATRLLRTAAATHPDVPAVLIARGAHAYQQGNLNEARRAFEALSDVATNVTEMGFWLYEVARLQGRTEDALRATERLIEARPDLGGHRLMAARFLADQGLEAEAEALLDAIPEALRTNPDLLEGMGRIEQRLGHAEDALRLLREGLAIRPQNPDLRATIARLNPDHVRVEDTFRVDPATLASAPTSTDDPDAEYLLDQKVVRMYPNGLSTVTFQRVVRVNRTSPGDDERSVHIPYDPFRNSVEVLRSEIRRLDGTVTPVTDQEEQSLTESWYGLYYDLRHIIVPFRHLRDGDLLVLEYRVSDVGRNLLSDSFSDLTILRDVIPKQRARYVLLTPTSREVKAALVDPKGDAAFTEEERVSDGLRIRTWEVRDLEALAVEDDMPGFAEVSPYIHVSTFADFESVARYYAALVEPQEQMSAAMRSHVHALVDGVQDPMERIRLIHNDLVRSNRYVGLEFGIHGYKPYPATQVFERRFGDCKDQSTLLKVMLAEAGVEAHLVLVRTRRLGRVPGFPASLAIFDHAICYLPAQDLWLDPTADNNGLFELPADDQGATALVIDDDGGRLVVVPESEPEDNVRSREIEIAPRLDGSAELKGSLRTGGLYSPDLREMFETKALRDKHLSEQLGAIFPGFRLRTSSFSGVDDLQAAIEIAFVGEAPDIVEVDGATLRVGSPDSPDEYTRLFAKSLIRKQDLLLDYPLVERRVERIVPPEGYIPGTGARTETVQSPFGIFTLRLGIEDGAMVRERILRIQTRRIPQSAYDTWRGFMRRIDELGRTGLVLRRADAS